MSLPTLDRLKENKSLPALRLIREAVEARPKELDQARAEGRKVVGFQGYNVPEEILHALGLIPVRLGTGGDTRLVEIGSRYISTKNCVFVRQTVGLFAENRDPYVLAADILVLDATCLQTYRTAEALQYFFKREVLILGVPRNFYWESALVYFAHEVENLVNKLEVVTGKRLEPKALEASLALYDAIREAIVELYRYQAVKDPIISWEEVTSVIHAGYYLDREKYSGLLRILLAELVAAQGPAVVGIRDGEARLFLSGSLIAPGDHKLVDIIREVGGRIVGDDLWSGLIPFLEVEVKEPTVEGVARAYLNRTPHGALPYLDLESDRRLKRLRELITEFKAQGVIYHSLRFCDPYTFKAKETKDVLAKVNVPFLEIHTEYATSDLEAVRTRVETFVEMIKLNSAVGVSA
jgi:benzoyl-CoA reductase/2-hydroxyglutaryl-CoA dehydratase subunit BcrC/BadD/HgdB